MAAADQIAQVAGRRPFDEALVLHPIVVEHLGEILIAAVWREHDDALRRRLLARIFQRGGEHRSGRRADEKPLALQQLARRGERFGVAHGIGAADPRQVGVHGNEILPNPLDQPAPRLA